MSEEKCHGILGVVDDKSGIREMLQEFLEMKGFEVHIAEDGYQAIELVEKHSLDLILMDLSMPNMNGLEAGKKIKEIKPEQKMIFLTGYDESIFIEKMQAVGDYDYIAKPFDLFEMVKKVKAHLGLPIEEKSTK